MLKESQNLNFAVPATTLAKALSGARARGGVLRLPPNADAQFSLGLLYLDGKGVSRDYTVAISWFRAAAEQGNAEAQVTLGGIYELGRDVPQDYTQAATWYRKAADLGNSRAQKSLGYLYEEGHGVSPDIAQAAMWYRKAADQGDTTAEYALGKLYARRDVTLAAAWYRKAAEDGLAPAQVSLGVSYMNGNGVPQNYGESYFWIGLATTGTVPGTKPEDVRALLESVATHLTARDLAQQQKRVREWVTVHATEVK